MIALNMKFNVADRARLLAMMTQFPRETYRGLGRSAAVLRGKLRKIMASGGGQDGVAKFAPKSEESEKLHPGRKLGGILAKSQSIQMYKTGRSVFTIGFLSSLAPWAKMFQEKESRELSKGEIGLFRKFKIKEVNSYLRPSRDVIETFVQANESNFLKWTLRNTEKILEKAKR